ncbi:MAG: hypothetical protein M3020_01125 [Myxococcota bacterium]|nr:hypothetical protein [Myxococcota bacterium]
MSGSITKLPEPLRTTGALELERRLLDAAAREEPSNEMLERMARSLGVATPVALAPSPRAGEGPLPDPGLTSAGTATGTSTLVPWLSGAIVVAAVTGAVFATRPDSEELVPPRAMNPVTAPQTAALQTPPLAAPVLPAPSSVEDSGKAVDASPTEQRVRSPKADIAEQIALIDAARTAVSSGSANRALRLVRQYQSKYPTGSFGPEATALKIEALTKLGRTTEARSAAERFVIQHRGTPIADRVARLAGLPREP